MELSLCMIVRNEEKTLRRCLESVQDAVDEIIVLDTGSQDQTKEIAGRFTQHVFDYCWQDDFAAARNASMARASKPFILWLDADDVMEESERRKLIALKAELHDGVDAVMMPYQCGVREDGSVQLVFDRERIVRRAAGFRFAGRVHEAMPVSGHVIRADIAVRHLGKPKPPGFRRNLEIYEKALSLGETLSARDQYYYARELMGCGEMQRAANAFARVLETGGLCAENEEDASVQYARCLMALSCHEEAKAVCMRLLAKRAPHAPVLLALGDLMMHANDLHAASFWYRAAMVAPRPSGSAFVYPDDYTYTPAMQLCVCLDRMGLTAQAESMNELALSYHPQDPNALANRAYFAKKRAGK